MKQINYSQNKSTLAIISLIISFVPVLTLLVGKKFISFFGSNPFSAIIFILPIIVIITACISLYLIKKNNLKSTAFAWTAIIISLIMILIAIFLNMFPLEILYG